MYQFLFIFLIQFSSQNIYIISRYMYQIHKYIGHCIFNNNINLCNLISIYKYRPRRIVVNTYFLVDPCAPDLSF